MTAYAKGAFSFSATSGALVVPTLPSVGEAFNKSNVSISFVTAPDAGSNVTYAVGASTYVTTAKYTHTGAPITFTPNVSISDADPVEYHWDFGDGVEGWGVSPQHEYKNAMQCQAVLCVTDSLGRKHYARRAMYLVNP